MKLQPILTAEEILARGASEGEWVVPTDLALTCTSSVFKAIVYRRAAAGNWYRPACAVIARGDRLFATIAFRDPKSSPVFLALDAWMLKDPLDALKLSVAADQENMGWAR